MISEHTYHHLNEIFLHLDNLVEIHWSTDIEDQAPIDSMEWDTDDLQDDLLSLDWH